MVLEVKRQEKETIQSLVHRFTKGVKESGVLRRARSIRFKTRVKSHDMEKKAALRKVELRKKYELMKKLGELEKTNR